MSKDNSRRAICNNVSEDIAGMNEAPDGCPRLSPRTGGLRVEVAEVEYTGRYIRAHPALRNHSTVFLSPAITLWMKASGVKETLAQATA
jgi:hypothetical protein